ncbi:MAG: hypothetical protein ACRDPA_26470 [Solirubrobacteraceae bacterium]
MSVRRNLIIASAAALVAGVIAVSAVAGAAPATTNHTITFIATQIARHQFSRSTAAVADVDRHHGKVVGYDVLSEKFSSTGGVIYGAYAPPGGGNYFSVTPIPITKTKTLQGKITGGSGRFAGVSGTIAIRYLNSAGTKTAVTIVYHH